MYSQTLTVTKDDQKIVEISAQFNREGLLLVKNAEDGLETIQYNVEEAKQLVRLILIAHSACPPAELYQ